MQHENHNEELLERLIALRDKILDTWGTDDDVVYTDEQLEMLSLSCPVTEDEFMRALFDRKRFLWYGDAFTGLIGDYLDGSLAGQDTSLTRYVQEETVTMGKLLEAVNAKRSPLGMEKLEPIKVSQLLMEMGYLESVRGATQNYRLPTDKGKEIGIETVERPDYPMVVYSPSAQLFVLKLLQKKGLLPD